VKRCRLVALQYSRPSSEFHGVFDTSNGASTGDTYYHDQPFNQQSGVSSNTHRGSERISWQRGRAQKKNYSTNINKLALYSICLSIDATLRPICTNFGRARERCFTGKAGSFPPFRSPSPPLPLSFPFPHFPFPSHSHPRPLKGKDIRHSYSATSRILQLQRRCSCHRQSWHTA